MLCSKSLTLTCADVLAIIMDIYKNGARRQLSIYYGIFICYLAECNKCTVLSPHTALIWTQCSALCFNLKKILLIIIACFSFTNGCYSNTLPCYGEMHTKTLLFFLLIIAGSGALRKKSAFLIEYLQYFAVTGADRKW